MQLKIRTLISVCIDEHKLEVEAENQNQKTRKAGAGAEGAKMPVNGRYVMTLLGVPTKTSRLVHKAYADKAGPVAWIMTVVVFAGLLGGGLGFLHWPALSLKT